MTNRKRKSMVTNFAFLFSSHCSNQKPHSKPCFSFFILSSIVTYVINFKNSRWHQILSRQSNIIDLSKTSVFFLNFSANALKNFKLLFYYAYRFTREKVIFWVRFFFKKGLILRIVIKRCNAVKKHYSLKKKRIFKQTLLTKRRKTAPSVSPWKASRSNAMNTISMMTAGIM